MTTYHLEPDSGPDLQFAGELIAVSDSREGESRADPGYDGGYWSVLRIYRTEAGEYVAEAIKCRNSLERSRAARCADHAAVVAFFHGPDGRNANWLTKDVLDQASIPHTEVIP